MFDENYLRMKKEKMTNFLKQFEEISKNKESLDSFIQTQNKEDKENVEDTGFKIYHLKHTSDSIKIEEFERLSEFGKKVNQVNSKYLSINR